MRTKRRCMVEREKRLKRAALPRQIKELDRLMQRDIDISWLEFRKRYKSTVAALNRIYLGNGVSIELYRASRKILY